jgi:sugar phosphate isomerase/epimerase
VTSSVPFGISQYTTWPLTWAEDMRLFRETGMDRVEICEAKLELTDPNPQLEELKASGMRVTSVQPRLHSLFPDMPRPLPRSPKERMLRLQASIQLFGRHFPGTTLVSITGAAPDGNYALAYETAAREYGEIARMAADHGVRVALEPLNPILMNVDTFICSIAHARRIIEEVDSPHFGLMLDVWHVWEDAAAAEEIRGMAGRIFGVHVNDWRTPRAFGDRLLPGKGEIPLVPLIRAIQAAGYDGAYTLEVFSELSLEGSLWADPRRTVEEGLRGFTEVWRQACA